MNTTIETIPTFWDDERDGQFFRITSSLFEPAFCSGAGALLASYDPDVTFAGSAPVAAPRDPAPSPVAFARTCSNRHHVRHD